MKTIRLAETGWRLCTVSGACLSASLVLFIADSGGAYGERNTALIFFKPGVIEAILGLTVVCNASLLVLLLYAMVKKLERTSQVAKALALSLSLYPAALILSVPAAFAKMEDWRVEQHIKGIDNRTYYILHAPNVWIGAGSWGLARRTGGTFFFYTMSIISSGTIVYNSDVLHCGLEDPNPDARRVCRMLLYTLKRRQATN